MITKTSSKLLIALLAALLLSGTVYSKAAAESMPPANADVSGEMTFTPLKFRSIFNMTEEESNRSLHSSSVSYTVLSVYGEFFILPVVARTKKIVDDTYKQISIDEKKEVLKSEFEKYIPSDILEIEWRFKSGYTVEIRELASQEIIGYTDDGGNVIANQMFFKEEILDKPFGEISFVFPDSEPFGSSLINEVNFQNLPNKISLGEYFEFYKKEIPDMYWPVRFDIKKNPNSSIPQLQDEILDRDIWYSTLTLWVFNDSERKVQKCCLSGQDFLKYYPEQNWITDLFTREKLVYEDKINNKYVENFQTEKDIVSFEGYSPRLFGFDFDRADYNPELKKVIHKFIQCRTVRDVIEAYQYLPMEMQVDYSYFDFSDSTNVDPAWLASRLAPPPTPTPPPYAELTIGNKGQEVLAMKQRFYDLGYYRTTSFNDRFTDSTADTVKLFEKNNGLPVDGVADAVMLGVLYSDGAVGK